MRIAVIGASGFVGATLVERLLAERQHQVVPFIHSTGNAWRLSRYGVDLRAVDLLSERDVQASLEGCTHVVNCSRGSEAVMLGGLRNLLRACKANAVERLVHLSSVAVYGDPPPPEASHEDVEPRPAEGSYGWIKLQQDRMVRAACQRGLPSVILCPPNISGAYSFFLLNVLRTMQAGRFALVDGGESACNLVDVENLTKAIMLGLVCEPADATRLFITDDEETTWADVAQALTTLTDGLPAAPGITREAVVAMQSTTVERRRPSPIEMIRFLARAPVRAVLRKDPFLETCERYVRGGITLLPRKALDHLRMWVNGPIRVEQTGQNSLYDETLCRIQLRGVRHRCDRAKALLGYSPAYTFAASMEVFRSWYETMYGCGSSGWLVKEL
jgi:nucleoside-diphosphate-sugar epimerase